MKNMPMLQVNIQRKKLLNSLIRSQTQYLIICFIKQLFVKTTTKLRVVFDASLHAIEFFNQCLPAGPNLNPDVLDALLGFRFHKIAINADIKMGYLQITLDSADRDAIRFLYIENSLYRIKFKIENIKNDHGFIRSKAQFIYVIICNDKT